MHFLPPGGTSVAGKNYILGMIFFVTNFNPDQCGQIWRNLAAWVKFLSVWHFGVILGEILNLLWQIVLAFGHILIVLNGEILNQKSGHTDPDLQHHYTQ